MYKYLKKLTTMSIAAGALIFTSPIYYYPLTSVAYAELQTYTGVGEYVMSNFETPDSAMARAKNYALRDAQEQAGVYMQSYSKSQNFKLVEDEITTMTAGIINIISTDYEPVPVKDTKGVIKYIATVKVNIDSSEINKWLERNEGAKLNTLVEQNKALQQANADQERELAELKKQLANVKTQKNKDKLTKQFATVEDKFMATQKADEAKNFYDKGEYQKSVKAATEAIKLNANLAVAYNIRGAAYDELDDINNAISDYIKAIEIDPNYADAYNNRGYAYYNLGNFDNAIADFNKAVKFDPKHYQAYNNRGVVYRHLGNYDRAIADFTKAIEFNPNFAEAYNNRGNTYYNLGNENHAIADYTKAIEINPKDFMSYYNRAFVYFQSGRTKLALADCDMAIKLNPTSKQAYHMRGNCYRDLGDYNRAKADFAKARELGYVD